MAKNQPPKERYISSLSLEWNFYTYLNSNNLLKNNDFKICFKKWGVKKKFYLKFKKKKIIVGFKDKG